MALCPNNHESGTNDFCSVCGIEMTAAGGAVKAGPVPTENCPICQTPRAPEGGDFCEECGYNFKTASPAPMASVVEPPAAAPEEPQPTNEPVSQTDAGNAHASPPEQREVEPAAREAGPVVTIDPGSAPTNAAYRGDERKQAEWEAVVSVDAGITGESDPDAPVGQPERLYLLDGDKSFGRKSVSRNILPDIDLSGDTAVSHQHGKLAVQSNGEIALVDLGSSNGTLLNKTKIAPNVLHLLKDGDVIGLGSWTKIVVRKSAK